MKLLPLDKLGINRENDSINCGILLPGITADDYELHINIIREDQQFTPHVTPAVFTMKHTASPYDYWHISIDGGSVRDTGGCKKWGKPGRYLYWYTIKRLFDDTVVNYIRDPFAGEYSTDTLPVFTIENKPYKWSASEKKWKTPIIDDLVFYELHLRDFGPGIEKARRKLDYLKHLGITCIKLKSPFFASELYSNFNLTEGYFSINEKYGTLNDFSKLIDEAHNKGIAVITEVNYAFTGITFTYSSLYRELELESPVNSTFTKSIFNKYTHSTNFREQFTRDFFYTVNYYWLTRFHLDGFYYTYLPDNNEWKDENNFTELVLKTYTMVKDASDEFTRFTDVDGGINLIQCAGDIKTPEDILYKTYCNAVSQRETITAAERAAWGNIDLTALGFSLGGERFPEVIIHEHEHEHKKDILRKAPLQFIETYNSPGFMENFAKKENNAEKTHLDDLRNDIWFKIQPYLIGLLSAKGVPLIVQGQELALYFDNTQMKTVNFSRLMKFGAYYDTAGEKIFSLVKKLIGIRKHNPHFRTGLYYFYNDYFSYQSNKVLLFSRFDKTHYSLIALNFSNANQEIEYTFDRSGNFTEELHGINNLKGIKKNETYNIIIPSNYGRIWTLKK